VERSNQHKYWRNKNKIRLTHLVCKYHIIYSDLVPASYDFTKVIKRKIRQY